MNDDDQTTGLAAGVLLAIVGSWVVARTIIHDASGKNLVDRLLAIAGGGASSKPLTSTNLVNVGPVHVGPGGIKAGPVKVGPTSGINVGPVHIPSPLPHLPSLP
jgi:hypothetical protein